MIDIHCHILPGIDDGPLSLQTSLAMASISAADGIKAIIATPHTDGIRVHYGSVGKAVSRLNRELQLSRIEIRIYPGYEIPYHLVSELAADHTLAGSEYVLVEFPHDHLPGGAFNTFLKLLSSGLKPVIAHPERNAAILHQPDLLNEFIEAGVLTQLTATSITGQLGPDIQWCATYLLKNDMAHFIATDSHSPTFRPPVLRKAHSAAKKIKSRQLADLLTIGNPGRVLPSTS